MSCAAPQPRAARVKQNRTRVQREVKRNRTQVERQAKALRRDFEKRGERASTGRVDEAVTEVQERVASTS